MEEKIKDLERIVYSLVNSDSKNHFEIEDLKEMHEETNKLLVSLTNQLVESNDNVKKLNKRFDKELDTYIKHAIDAKEYAERFDDDVEDLKDRIKRTACCLCCCLS